MLTSNHHHPFSNVTPFVSLPPSPQTRPTWPATPTHHPVLALMETAVPSLASFAPPQSPRCPVSHSSGQASLSGAPHHYSFIGRCVSGGGHDQHNPLMFDALEHSGGSAISSIAAHPLDALRFAGRDLTPPPKINAAMPVPDDIHLGNGSVTTAPSSPLGAFRSFGQRPQSFAGAAVDYSSPTTPATSHPRRHSSGLQAHFDSANDNPLRDRNSATTTDASNCASPEVHAADALIASVTSFGDRSVPNASAYHRPVGINTVTSRQQHHVAFSSAQRSALEVELPSHHDQSFRKRMLHFGGILDDGPNEDVNGSVFGASSASPFSRSASVAGFDVKHYTVTMGVVQRPLDTPSHWGSLRAPPALESLE